MTAAIESRERPHLTVRDVATQLQVDPETVRGWIASGLLPAIDLGSRRSGYRITAADLAAFVHVRRTMAGQVGQPWRSYIALEHRGLPEYGRPSALKGLLHEQALFAQILAREQIIHHYSALDETQPFDPLPRDWRHMSPPAEFSLAIEAISPFGNEQLCFWCGQMPLPQVRLDASRERIRRCTHCGVLCTYQHSLERCLRVGCWGVGEGISLGAPLEVRPRSIATGRIRSAHGMAYCNNCKLGWLYRWNAHAEGARLTLIGWDGPGRRVSATHPVWAFGRE